MKKEHNKLTIFTGCFVIKALYDCTVYSKILVYIASRFLTRFKFRMVQNQIFCLNAFWVVKSTDIRTYSVTVQFMYSTKKAKHSQNP